VFLPLHAAGIYQGTAGDQACCSDYFVSSYTPTISTLLRAQAQASAVNKSGVDMLLVGEDCASGPMPRIPSVQKELRGIEAVVTAKQFGRTMEVIRSAATVERVAERAKSAHFLHLACHGIQHWTSLACLSVSLRDGQRRYQATGSSHASCSSNAVCRLQTCRSDDVVSRGEARHSTKLTRPAG
jgi:CHAT domain-containing protein